ncbi:unnamed protein product [Eruca vesicaria subsp. sativa]|uniref:TIR domain-containing protein n=1 Tax=Eruca vesicaria subsp. sativa TaxID=29727 RepID=A0ABC8IU04_ERUVS|nr:unnamed protein product [Eruca vesicaria subsp. sativa]
MASSSRSRECESKYDVFLSFRGVDTRLSIVSHLYEELVSRGLVTFKDDKRLEIGDNISDELHRAIQGLNNVIVLLSEKYATSRWCLMELQLIMELQREGRLRVLPVFYKVEPSDVRHQRECFNLERYKGTEMAPMWGEALNQIANLSGVEFKSCTDEGTMVRILAQEISDRTARRNIDATHIVGVEIHMQSLKYLLDMDSEYDEVRMIGIWGMGGIGKTAIAKCLYGQLSLQFKARYFSQEVRGIHKDLDLQHLQKELLYSTLQEEISLWSVEAGGEEIRSRLIHKSVLLVLDGVDKIDQVHALAKETAWFGPRSIIIITTRDRGLLRSCGVETIYEVKCLDDEASLKMFKQIAFKGGSPPPCDDFEQLSVRAAGLAHGLPSALRAYALFLRGRDNSPGEWEEAICGLESNPDEKVMEVLKLSYDGLAKQHQNVFLQVACLFNGGTFQRVISLLDGYEDEKKLCLKILAEKSLINIATSEYVILHKLVEQMGRGIMLDCGKFLGDAETIRDALVYEDGTKVTECISLHICELNSPFSMESGFNRMRGLKFLKVYKHVENIKPNLTVIRNDINLPYSVRLLHWDSLPLRTFPLKVDEYFIVELNLRHSSLKTFWGGTPHLKKLKRVDVTGSKKLKRLPNLSDVKNLEELILEQCTRLQGVPESIGETSALRRLNLSYNGGPESLMSVVIKEVSGTQCVAVMFPTANVKMELTNVSIEGDIEFQYPSFCEGNAEYFSFGPVTTKMSLQQAQLISEFNKFVSLNIKRLSYKEKGPPMVFHRFPDILTLKELKLINLNIQILPDGIGQLEFLEKLDLSGNDFENLPEAMSTLPLLKTLRLQNCRKLEKLPELAQVQSLTLLNCRNLRSLVKHSDSGRYCLLELCLDNCNNVEPFSDQLSPYTKLTYLDLSSHDFETLPSSISDLTSLVTLCLNNCKSLKSVEVLPQSLQFLHAHGCDLLEADALENLNVRINKKMPGQSFSSYPYASVMSAAPHVSSVCFQETGMLSPERDQQATKSRLPKFLSCLF